MAHKEHLDALFCVNLIILLRNPGLICKAGSTGQNVTQAIRSSFITDKVIM